MAIAVFGFVAIFGAYFYNNQFYAYRVINAIENENIAQLENLMKSPFGNLNCKPTLCFFEVLNEKTEPTPLQAACKLGNQKIVKMLLENGADVNYTHWYRSDSQGSPLTNAAGSLSNERLQVIKLLIENGADINYQTATGDDVLSCAVYASCERNDIIEIIEYLEQQGADVYKKYSESCNTLLHKACVRGDLLTIRYLVEDKGFDINGQNADGDTPLIYFMRFASERNKDALHFLIENGANKNIENKEGKTAYDYAVERHPEFVDLLG